ncbi:MULTISPECIES: DUF4224 domain-containing protein [unclassified Comamonas]|uniref:DUF4224 domain-containing protein n=1 Tax=unclassified Comamonas TaxID=2638500 RepID=UPI000EB27D54|nr:DUF4224 domain-containing protein [Comamonas sp. lk]
MTTFLTPDEIKELTGVNTGKNGKKREELQVSALRTMKIPFYINAVGRPIVTRSTIEGSTRKKEQAPSWEPALSHG